MNYKTLISNETISICYMDKSMCFDVWQNSLDENNRRLRSELDSCQASLRAFQEAYASIYAHALGVDFDLSQIVSSMSVESLQQMISSATNSVNIIPSVTTMDGMFIDDDDNGDLITL